MRSTVCRTLRLWARDVFVRAGALLFVVVALVGSPAADAATVERAPRVEMGEPPPVPEGLQTVPGIDLDVHGHAHQYPLLLALARHGSEAVPRLAEQLGVPVGGRISVFVAATDEEFRTMQPGRPPEWADATAWPDRGTVFLRSPIARGESTRPLLVVFEHELVHVLLGRAFAPNEPPRWLQEGAAQSFAGETDLHMAANLARGALIGPYRLAELHSGFPRDPDGARIAYAESASFVTFVRSQYGDAAFRSLLRDLATGRSIEGAVHGAMGESLGDVEARWRAGLDARGPLWLSGLAAEELLWVGVGLLAIAAVLRQRRLVRSRILALADEEASLDALARELTAQRYRPDIGLVVDG